MPPVEAKVMGGRPVTPQQQQRTRSGSRRIGSGRIGDTKQATITTPQSPAFNQSQKEDDSQQIRFEEEDQMGPTQKEKWQRRHETNASRKLVRRRTERKLNVAASREKAQNLARSIPVELLARDWFRDQRATLDARAYLVDSLLPTLVLGAEKLLEEATNRCLTEKCEASPDFNPINYLAAYLMRNNPRYAQFSETSPYVRGLREVAGNLREQMFELEDNKLAKIKANSKKKREEREKAAEQEKHESKRREDILSQNFLEWDLGETSRMELVLAQSSLQSFEDLAERFPPDIREAAKFTQSVSSDASSADGRTLSIDEFCQYVAKFVEDFSSALFDQFAIHMTRCAQAYKATLQRGQRKVVLSNLFIACDNSGIGVLDRHRVLHLFEEYYDKKDEAAKKTYQNPRQWPLIEVNEADSDFSEDEDDTPMKETGDSDAVTTETSAAKGEGEKKEPDQAVIEPVIGAVKAEVCGDNADSLPSVVVVDAESKGGDSLAAAPGKSDAPPEAAVAVEDTQATDSAASDSAALADGSTAPAQEEGKLSEEDDGKPPPTGGGASVSFAEGTILERERTLLETRGTGSQSQMSAFDESSVNMSQFVLMTETFLGDYPAIREFQELCRFINDGYIETEQEKITRLTMAHEEVKKSKRKMRLDLLFDKWDNEGSGYVEMDEIETIVGKYKEGLERVAIKQAQALFKEENPLAEDGRLIRREFKALILAVVKALPGDNAFDYFLDFLETNVERTYAERIRGEARKKWLQYVMEAAETSAASMENVYRAVFRALYKDAEVHGGGKVISSSVSVLEKNTKLPIDEWGESVLRCVACTSDDAPFMLEKRLYRTMRNVSYAAVDSGKPLHVPRVSNHGNVSFWNEERPEEERDGSFVVVPLKDQKKRVFGVLGIDTMRDLRAKAIFITHEIQFYQGVAKTFSMGFHHVDIKRKSMRIAESAISWICRSNAHVLEINVFLVEPDRKNDDYVLRRMMMATGEQGNLKHFESPARLNRKDNLFRDYIFKAVDNSETVTADAYGQRHFAFPLRNADGRAQAVIDISTGDAKAIPKYERREILKMLKLMQTAQREITKESLGEPKTMVLELEKEDEEVRVEVMFDRLMLTDLREKVVNLDSKAYAELKSYKDPPPVTHAIVKATLSLFFLDKGNAGEFESWNTCKMHINSQLSTLIATFDPTAEGCEHLPVDKIREPLLEIPHGAVGKHSSKPASYLYNWTSVCLSLIEHCKRMRVGGSEEPALKAPINTGLTPTVLNPDVDEED